MEGAPLIITPGILGLPPGHPLKNCRAPSSRYAETLRSRLGNRLRILRLITCHYVFSMSPSLVPGSRRARTTTSLLSWCLGQCLALSRGHVFAD